MKMNTQKKYMYLAKLRFKSFYCVNYLNLRHGLLLVQRYRLCGEKQD